MDIFKSSMIFNEFYVTSQDTLFRLNYLKRGSKNLFDVKYSKKKNTEYGIGWLPLGGYVKISGMIDESMDKEQMATTTALNFSKASIQRLIIMLGGVTVNFILAFIIYIGMAFVYGDTYIANADMKDGLLMKIKPC
jgi:regulator of sigma E protease